MASLGKLSARNIVKSGKDIIDQSSHILSIPDTFLALLPAFDALVPDILQFTFLPLNTTSSQLVAPPVTRFHNHLPTAIDEDLLRHSVPDASLCQSLQMEWQSLQHRDELELVLHCYQKVSSRAKYRATHLGRPMEIAYYQLVPTSELLMCVGFVNMPHSDVEEVELKDRRVVEEREELLRLLPELEKAGIPRVGSKTGTEL